jgi:hypothetical protein
MPNVLRAMGRKALVVLICFVICASFLALCSNHRSPLGPVKLLIVAMLALRKHGSSNFGGLESIPNHDPTVLDVGFDGLALANSSHGQKVRQLDRRTNGKVSITGSHLAGATPLAFKGNSSSSLSWSQKGTTDVGLAGAETLANHRSPEPVALTHVSPKNYNGQPRSRLLYWGPEVDHPNAACSGFNHQAVSIVCALNEALATGRTFILPSHICISRLHRGLSQLQRAAGAQEGGAKSPKKQEGGVESMKRAKNNGTNVLEGEGSKGQGVNEAVGASSDSWAELESLIDVGCVNRFVPVILNTLTEVNAFLHQWESQSRGPHVGSCFNSTSSMLGLTNNKTHPLEGVIHQLEVPSKAEPSKGVTFSQRNDGEGLGSLDEKRKSSQSVCVNDGRVRSADMAPWNASELLIRTRPRGIHFPWFEVCKQGRFKERIW